MSDAPPDVAQLRQEVAELRTQLDDRSAKERRRMRWRQRCVIALVVLTSLGVFASAVGLWVNRTIYDTDAWIRTVQDLPSDPAVAEALATRITDEIVALTDPEDRIRGFLPPEASLLAGPITAALQQLVTNAVTTVIESDQFHDIWIAVNRAAHSRLVAVLDGDSTAVTVHGGTVTLDLQPLIAEVLDRLPAGLLGRGDAPDLDASTSVDEARRLLSQHLGVELPDDFGQIEVFQSDDLAAIQDLLALFDRILIVTVVATILLAAAAVALSRRRRRTIIGLGIGTVAAIAVAWTIARMLKEQVVESLSDPGARGAAEVVLGSLYDQLRGLTIGVLIIGALVAIGAFVIGDSRPARWTQEQAKLLATSAATTATRTAHGSSVAAWSAANELGLRVGGLVVAIVLLLLVSVSWEWLVVLGLLLGAWQLAVTGLTSAARRTDA